MNTCPRKEDELAFKCVPRKSEKHKQNSDVQNATMSHFKKSISHLKNWDRWKSKLLILILGLFNDTFNRAIYMVSIVYY
jgi:hypothetical protein